MTEKTIQLVRLLAVTRDADMVRLLAPLEKSGWRLETVASSWQAMERMQSGAASHLLLLDIPRNDTETLHFLRWLTHLRPDLPVLLLCHPADSRRVKESAGLGGAEILARPLDGRQIEAAIRRQLKPAEKGADLDVIGNDMIGNNKNIEPLGPETFFVSASPIMQKLRAQAALLAKSDVPVLILGESGAGKHAVANLIHQLSVRSGFKLQRVNCAEMPESVLEAELFGDNTAEVDSATGPRPLSLGKFAAGEKGTIFLDEIAEMPSALQARLLQVLQNDDLRKPSGTESTSAEVRILASSSANIEHALAEKQISEGLYYRLSAFTVQVPPLRQRKDEIATLLRYFMHKLARHYSLPARAFPSSMITACQQYPWPENLKELEAFVKRYLVAGDQGMALAEIGAREDGLGQLTVAHAAKLSPTAWEESRTGQGLTKPESLKSLIQGVKSEAERNAIGAALMRTGWNRKAAARLLRVSYRTLLYKIEQYQMRAPQPYLSPLPAGEFSLYDEVKGNGKAS